MLAKDFDNKGIEYRIFDARLPFAASIISENLFSDSWLKDVSYIKNSLDFIHDNYEVEKRTFLGKTTQKDLYHLPIPQVLRSDYINEKYWKQQKKALERLKTFIRVSISFARGCWLKSYLNCLI